MNLVCRLCQGFICLFVLVGALTGCDPNLKKRETASMNTLTPRLESIFEKTRTVCFGRFMVDLPQSATVVWGGASVPLDVEILPNGSDKVKELAQLFIEELRKEKAIYLNRVPLLISVEVVANPKGLLVVGYDGFEAISDLKINGYFQVNGDGVIVNARPLKEDMDRAISRIRSIAGRFQRRSDSEIPSSPGNCIEHGFLIDETNSNQQYILEHIRVGFRIKEFPDAHFSIYVAPANLHNPQSDSLEDQWKRVFNDPMSLAEKKILGSTKFFRQKPREILDWKTGYEVLMRSPDEEGSYSHHEFQAKFIGIPKDPYRPYADIQFQTGVANNAAGATKASLTDEEAIAIWDKITSSIRVRPTTDKAVKTSDAAHAKRRPLGELAATGRTCTQTGWWEASEEDHIAGDRRRYIQLGELMPHAVSRGKPSMWQKFKGEQPTYQAATVWKLVSYDDGPSKAKATPPAAFVAQTMPDDTAVGKTEGEKPDDRNDDSVPEQRG